MSNRILQNLYNNQQYSEIIDIYYSKDVKSDELLLYSGLIFTKMGLANESVKCLSNLDYKNFMDLAGEANRCVALSYFLLSNYDLSESYFMVAEKYQDNESTLWRNLLFPSDININETEFINFRFVDSFNAFEKKVFIIKSIKSFKYISKFIGLNTLDKKIDIYIYNNRYDSIGNSLSYSDNGLKVIHTYVNDVKGHEIAHIMFNNIYKNMNRNRFIDEGIATFFDDEDTFDSFILKYKECISFLDLKYVWNNQYIKIKNLKGYYYFAGAFIGFLIKTYGREAFIEFIKDESYQNAKKIFGSSLNLCIEHFYELIK